jgi:GTPase SAR1 family protein
VPNWITFIKNIENPLIVLVGNKLDQERKVETSEGERLALKENLLFFEISAKTNENVKKLFYSVIAELPYFEQYNTSKLKLIGELEEENNESKLGDSVMGVDNLGGGGLHVQTQGSRNSGQTNKGCAC